MLRIRDLILPETHDVSELYYHAAQALHVRASDIAALHIFRRSLDARKKPDLRWVYTVDVTLRSGEGAVLRRCRSAKITREAPYVYRIPRCTAAERPVVVGFGPAGMFAALVLAKAGLQPLVLERGDPAPLRREKVERFWSGGPLDRNRRGTVVCMPGRHSRHRPQRPRYVPLAPRSRDPHAAEAVCHGCAHRASAGRYRPCTVRQAARRAATGRL